MRWNLLLFVCLVITSQSTSIGLTWVSNGKFEYAVGSTKLNFTNAALRCMSLNGTLAIIKSAGTTAFLNGTNIVTAATWIGLEDKIGFTKNYTWIDGTPLLESEKTFLDGKITNVNGASPDCVAVKPYMWWVSRVCTQKKYSLCQRKTSTPTPLTTTPPLATTTTLLATTTPLATTTLLATTIPLATKTSMATSTTLARTTSLATKTSLATMTPLATTTILAKTTPLATTTTPLATRTPIVTMTPLATTSRKPNTLTSSALETQNSVIKVFCKTTVVSASNKTFNFAQVEVGQTAVSQQTCSLTGNPEASAPCLQNATDAKSAYFGKPIIISCGTTLGSLSTTVNVSQATTSSVTTTVAKLKLLTSSPPKLNKADVANAISVLNALSYTDPLKVQITVNTMYDVLLTTNQVAVTFQNTTDSKTAASQKSFLIKSVESFTNRVTLPANTTVLTISTIQTTIQVSQTKKTAQNKYAPVSFAPGNNSAITGTNVVTATIPGSVLDAVGSTGGNTSVRASFIFHSSSTLFPAAEKAPMVITVNVKDHKGMAIKAPVELTFTNISEKQGNVPFTNGSLKDVVTRTQCSVYHASGKWIPNSCRLIAGSSPPKCACAVLASFSMIVSTKILPSAFAMGVVSYIGCALSVLGLTATIGIYMGIKELRQRQPTVFLLNICFNLLIADIIFLFGVGWTSNTIGCYIVTGLLHYFLLTTWFWMSANAYNMYKALTTMAYIGGTSPIIPAIICYVGPMVIVAINSTISAVVDRTNYFPDDIFFTSVYKARHMCWLSEHSMNYGFLLPVGILALCNIASFVIVICKITCLRTKVSSTSRERNPKDDFAVAVAVCIMMGLTWVFGFFMLLADNVTYQTIMSWLFTIFNSTQGFLIFVLNCLRQNKIRVMWWGACVSFIMCRKNEHNKGPRSSAGSVSTRL